MSVQTGRLTDNFIRVIIGISSTLYEWPIDSVNEVGLTYEPKDVSAWQDAIRNILAGQPAAPLKLTGPVDTSALVAAATSGQAPVLSGSFTVLQPINGDRQPHTLQVLFGVRHYWETGEQGFGLQRDTSKNSGYTLTKFTVSGGKYNAELDVMGGVAPSWGTALLTVGS